MKIRLIVAIVLLVICLGGAFFCMTHARRCAGELIESLQTALAAAAIEGKNWAEATSEAIGIWERDSGFYHILLPHMNLNELEWALGSLPEYLVAREQKLFIEQCVRAIQCVNTIREMEMPSWGNIF